MTPRISNDAELLERWRHGDQAAGEMLFERYYVQVERFFINKVGPDIDDLIQETFAACVTSRERLADASRFRSYLFAVAYRVLFGYLRTKYRRQPFVDLEQVSVRDLAPGQGTIEAGRAEQRLLLEALRSLPVTGQVLIELHYWERLTTTEMAEVLGIPLGTVRGRLRRARGQLGEVLGQLEASPGRLATTFSNLDDWAARCRDRAARPAADRRT
ncbi:MAG: sigma-70 family RNA polymerase sigma factor [Myxococcales bacterium FL481]|nr:MAG: sigma-70 family RNA polymerase sigma factor [Myxococcales bacterium FL481]